MKKKKYSLKLNVSKLEGKKEEKKKKKEKKRNNAPGSIFFFKHARKDWHPINCHTYNGTNNSVAPTPTAPLLMLLVRSAPLTVQIESCFSLGV